MRTYTNVTATIALFIALGGSSYAAASLTGADVRNGTVTGADLRSESVKGRDVDNGSLTGSDLKPGSVTTSDLDDGSLLGADFKAGQLAAGPVGPQGPAGTTEVLSRRVAEVPLLEGERKEVIARCLPGEVAVGGGAVHDGTVSDLVSIAYSYPLEADDSPPEDGERATAWLAGGHNLFISGVDRKMTVYVLCANA
jgi:hypothetical protein